MQEKQKSLDYLNVLKALNEIPFAVGRGLLIAFLQGRKDNASIKKNRLERGNSFGSMGYDKDELNSMIDSLILNSLVSVSSMPGNRFWKVLELTEAGNKELAQPSLYKKRVAFQISGNSSCVDDSDRALFASLGGILKGFNDEQKKAIISNKEHILCLAGAGSGKTTVLTQRIDFLIRYRSAIPSGMLAITFTRKARHEMAERLSRLGHKESVMVETFNSFCEKILKKYNDIIYEKPVRVINYAEKLLVVEKAVESLCLDMQTAIDLYFNEVQLRIKTRAQLMYILVNDCFFIRDYFKWKNRQISELSGLGKEHAASALVFGICNYIEAYMKKYGLRDYADQLIDTITLFEKRQDLIPGFEHILVDEYQDVNSTQIKLLDMLSPKNLFCVGDPRQSIYGWRGSDIRYILRFTEKFPDSEVVTLKRNYRSTKYIVDLINSSIKSIGLSDLEAANEGERDVHLIKLKSEADESQFVIEEILKSTLPRSEIFVLARTNRQLLELSKYLKLKSIRHIVRSDEINTSVAAAPEEVTLATIHAIKGLEAEMVFVIGCTGQNFPCKGSEHPVIELIKLDEYDKEEEERRLFYVAMSRAKKTLYMTYTSSKPTYFINEKMRSMLEVHPGLEDKSKLKALKTKNTKTHPDNMEFNETGKPSESLQSSVVAMSRLKEWRRELAKELNVPAYVILHDKTLIELAQRMPRTLEELEEIYGFGPTKISRFGEQVLDILLA